MGPKHRSPPAARYKVIVYAEIAEGIYIMIVRLAKDDDTVMSDPNYVDIG